jgi:sugar (pentulose or hexulose) kinase
MTALETTPRHIAVIDIGKTNAKLALVDLVTLQERAVVTRPNTVLPGPPWPHFDVEGHWAFLLDALADFHRDHRVDAISVTTHGACAALLDASGALAAPILDYEHEGPDAVAADYDAIRPSFAETGSPRLAGGLNVGAQLHWQFSTDPGLRDRTAHIVTYPQYWGYRLTGVVASDVTSIGCHTDLWNPRESTFSSLPSRLGIEDKIAPVRKSTDLLGSILPEIAARTGLPTGTAVSVGIHDSNASLYPHILTQEAPFSVVSTGTWVIAMAMGGSVQALDPRRDTLLNVSARGEPVPSARFMGGREYEMIRAGHSAPASDADILEILESQTMLMPAVEPLTGPFQGKAMRWIGQEPGPGTGARIAALSFYLAMMTDACLRLTGASGPTIVEGPFANNAEFMGMLEIATERPVLRNQSATGTSIGAALLIGKSDALSTPIPIDHPENATLRHAYAANWRRHVDDLRPDSARH